jgi:DNA (cytosine-5)-methyltransferase 1
LTGGIDLAAEWAGFETVGQCEWADYPTKVLEKHWPDVPRWRDIRSVTAEDFYKRTGLRTVDLISGGFPCQPFSTAGNRKGKEDDRYLWPEMLRVIQELQPTWVIGENVAGLASMAEQQGKVRVEDRNITRSENQDAYSAIHIQQEVMLFRKICKELEDIGYEVQPFIIPACGVDAPHRRERVFILAHSKCNGLAASERTRSTNEADGEEQAGQDNAFNIEGTSGIRGNVAYTTVEGLERNARTELQGEYGGLTMCGKDVAYTYIPGPQRYREHGECTDKLPAWEGSKPFFGIWESEPELGRVANGVPSRVDRLKCLGNAVVPQQVYPILQAIADIERS